MATSSLPTIDLHLARSLDSARQVAFDWLIATDELYLGGELAESFRGVLMAPTAVWHSRDLFALVHDDDRVRFQSQVVKALKITPDGGSTVVHDVALRLRNPNGSWRWIELHAQVVARSVDARAVRMVGTVTDINERKQADEKIGRLRDLYAALSQTNQAIIRTADPATLYGEICRIAVEHGRFRLAWIGLVDDATLQVRPVAISGQGQSAVHRASISVDGTRPEGRGSIGTAIREGRHAVYNDFFAEPKLKPWYEFAREAGIRSSASFPFAQGGRMIGSLNLYAAQAGFFDEALIDLLDEMSRDISFALDNYQKELARESVETALAHSEQLKSAILGSALDCIVTIDHEGTILNFNPAAERTFGHRSDDIIGSRMSEAIIPPEMRIYHERGLANYVKTRHGTILNRRIEQIAMHADGHRIPVELTVVPIVVDGQPIFTAFLRDISERKRAEDLQLAQNRILNMVVTGATLKEIIHEITQFVEKQAAPALCSMMLLEAGSSNLTAVATDQLPPAYQALYATLPLGATGLSCGEAAAAVEAVVSADIASDPLWTAARHVALASGIQAVASWPICGKQRKVLGTLALHYPQPTAPGERDRQLLDIATNLAGIAIENRESEDKIRFLAHYDGLTALPNRFLFKEFLEHALRRARRNATRFAVFFVDLDRFKNINDTFGHDAGDKALQEIAKRLTSVLRKSDTVARMGGDEFYLLIEDLPDDQYAADVAQKLLLETARPFYVDGQECQLTASIGIVIFPEDADDAQTLLKHSDIAMYRAKGVGKNTYQFYAASKHTHSVERITLESRLRRAIEREEFILHYQPKVDLRTGMVTGLEALVRWQHPENGLLGPAHFIAIAEESSLIVPLGRHILEIAIRDAAVLRGAIPEPVRIAVNLSARQLSDHHFLDDLKQLLAVPGAERMLLDLEITESMVMTNPEQAVRIMSELQAMGIRLAIDDFGTGYSSLAYLKRFPVHSLKIDRSFVQDIPGDPNDTAITQAIIAMGHTLGLRVIAEGVETAAQMEALRAYGCDEMQGYHFCRPMALDAVIAVLAKVPAPAAAPVLPG